MSKVTITSLKRENDSLKEEIATLRRGFENLQQTLTRNDAQESGNGGEASCSITKDEALNTLQFYGKAYDDLRSEADKSLQQLWSHLKALTSRVDDIGNAIDEIQRYSYQYNVKIVGLPEIDPQESASATTSLCISLLKASGVNINIQDVDIAHRVPTRQATAGPRPVICKFTRRIVKEEVMNLRKEACKISATSIGLPAECSLGNVKIFDHLTPQTQKLLADAKKFQARNGYRFCWSKNFVVYLRKSEDSRPIRLKSQEDLERFARQEDLPMS